RHHLRLGKMLAATPYLPDAVIRLVPDRLKVRDQAAFQMPNSPSWLKGRPAGRHTKRQELRRRRRVEPDRTPRYRCEPALNLRSRGAKALRTPPAAVRRPRHT